MRQNTPFRSEIFRNPPSYATHDAQNDKAEEYDKLTLVARIRHLDESLDDWGLNGPGVWCLTDRHVRAIAEHPDERVPLLAIARLGRYMGGPAIWQLYLRGRRICQQENIAWNPILDAMAAYDCWPWEGTYSPVESSLYNDIEEYLAPLKEWVEAQTSPEALKPLLRFRSYPVLDLVARHANVLATEFVQYLPLPSLANNPKLTQELANLIAHQAIELLRASDLRKVSHRIPIEHRRSVESYAIQALEELTRNGRTIEPQIIERLIQGLGQGGQTKNLCLHALTKLGHQVSEQHLMTAIGTVSPHNLVTLAKHPSATPVVWRYALQTTTERVQSQLCDMFSAKLRALKDPELRKHILETGDFHNLRKALDTTATAEDELFLEILDALLVKWPAEATRIIAYTRAEANIPWVNRVREQHIEKVITIVLRINSIVALTYLLNYEPTGNDVRIQEALVKNAYVDSYTLFRLLERTKGELFRHVFARLATSGGREIVVRLLDTLERASLVGISDLKPEDYAPLLQSEDTELRLKAISVLPKLDNTAGARTTESRPAHQRQLG